MPNTDNTGPEGMGPTGRGQGTCPNKDNLFTSRLGPGLGKKGRGGSGRRGARGCSQSQGRGRGGRVGGCAQSRGPGRGQMRDSMMGAGRSFYFSRKDESAFLEHEIRVAEEQLVIMKNRLSEISE